MGLAGQRAVLAASGLTPGVISTIEGARAASTNIAYDSRWKFFGRWCAEQAPPLVPSLAPVADVLRFLQCRKEEGLAYSTVKVYLSSISAYHQEVDGAPIGRHGLVSAFMKGVKRATATEKPLFPGWELAVVLDGLLKPPFEPLESADVKTLTLKTVLLVALTTTKRVSDIHALSVDPDCMQFSDDGLSVRLKPNLKFVTKTLRVPEVPLKLVAFHPPPFNTVADERLHGLCPVRALRLYVRATGGSRSTNQLFVSYKPGARHSAVARSSVSRWVVEAIKLACVSAGVPVPAHVRAHSTRGVASSWALARGASVQEICDAANWSTPSTFATFYQLDLARSSVAHAVLGVAGTPAQ